MNSGLESGLWTLVFGVRSLEKGLGRVFSRSQNISCTFIGTLPCLELKEKAATYYDMKVLIRCQSTGKGAEKKRWEPRGRSLSRYYATGLKNLKALRVILRQAAKYYELLVAVLNKRS